ncbi:UNVERIFIED_CONTAM: NADPH:quinone oxidoreductase [Sesamum angustifolium]|uniref:NAD(P)H dehydrogenase (quinone) n=1 Tax=Sesamum angustifolium TaxID=2727405 RepID=A0AAW2J3P7_9LAMI
MALAMATMAGFCGTCHAVLEGSLHLSGSSSLLSMPKTNRFAFAEPGLRVRAQQQTSAETETGRRAMLGFLLLGWPQGKIIVAGIPGLISEKSDSQGLIRAAAKLRISGLVLLPVDVTKLPLINVEDHPNLPTEVQAFMDQILLADAILFSAPEYNYSVTPITKNAIDWLSQRPETLAGKTAAIISTGWDFGGGRMQYHLRQIGVRPDLHFINTPEVFVSTTVDAQHPPKFDANGDLIDDNVRAQLQQLLVSLRDFTLPLKYGNKTVKDSGILT